MSKLSYRRQVINRWPSNFLRDIAARTWLYFIGWLGSEVLVALLPFTIAAIALSSVGKLKSVNDVIRPRDLFLLSAGLLLARLPDVLEIIHHSLMVVLTGVSYLLVWFGIAEGNEILVNDILHPALHDNHVRWIIAIVYTLSVTLAIP